MPGISKKLPMVSDATTFSPRGIAILATSGAVKQAEHIRTKANTTREALNKEKGGLAEQITNVVLTFTSKAGETGKLYGSITNIMIAESLSQKLGTEIDRHQVDVQPIRTLGEHKAVVRLTVDLNPEVKVIVSREGEKIGSLQSRPRQKSGSRSRSGARCGTRF